MTSSGKVTVLGKKRKVRTHGNQDSREKGRKTALY
jgi:hypothetical protein